MARELVTADAVTQAILHRIATGQLTPGDRLPPVRKLAEELGSNRNTVNKAYQMLGEMGVVNNDSGRKGYTVRRGGQANTTSRAELLDYFQRQSVNLAWKQMAAGITSNEMRDLWENAIAEVFGHSQVDLIFYECNDHDTIEMGQRLIEVLTLPVEYHNLPHFYADPAANFKKHDLIITTYHHLGEITEAIAGLGLPTDKVVGIETRVSPDAMVRIARFPKQRIGVVCTNANTAHMLKHLLTGYRSEWIIEAASLEEPEHIKPLADRCEHFVVTHTCADEVFAITKRTPDVVVNFQIDEQSVAYLNQRIIEIRQERLTRLRSDASSTPLVEALP